MSVSAWGACVLAVGLLLALTAYARAARKLRRTELLFEVSLQLGSTLDGRELQRQIMDTAARVTDAEASSILLVDRQTQELYFELALGERGDEIREIRLSPGEGIAGRVAESGQPVILNDPAADPRWSSRVASKTGVQTRNLLCVPIYSQNRVIGVLQVLNKRGSHPFSAADQALLAHVAAPIAVALENARLFDALEQTTMAKNTLENELRFAGEIQLSFLPKQPIPQTGGCAAAALLLPARQAGGDFYHYELLGDEELFFAIGDVSDKGVPAALFMAAAVTLIKGTMRPGMTPSELLTHVNALLCRDEPTQFATVLCGVLRFSDGRLLLSDGGHCAPLLLDASGKARRLETVKRLPLGAWPDTAYADVELTMHPGEQLVLYTDGIVEAEDREQHQYAMARLEAYLEAHASESPEELASGLVRDVSRYAGGWPQSDDIAVLCIRNNQRTSKEGAS
ncbi:SpoIIE family protein phosphatase [Paenibacillus sp. IB182496]|uniref:SpoIIE family protein phosphatase n=1 Tax=Paenibacillus sabuli TaxID=2772509 RepID=A0A927BUR0_9BACL|nr:GAF domain-containing SpoIIE family protein phosphatase [Paenibacillus sabuli]MBD2846095.1 SpoIIE family protein phosphatase [Paenibacillus sabuli]